MWIKKIQGKGKLLLFDKGHFVDKERSSPFICRYEMAQKCGTWVGLGQLTPNRKEKP